MLEKTDVFASYHPLVNFLYFVLVIGFSMLLMHPICLAVSLVGSILYAVYLEGRKAALFALRVALPMMLMAALINPAFSHAGITILCYLPTGNPLTLESVLYGIAAATMMVAVIFWFRCYNSVMTSDKFVYLFGKVIPALSLILSMALRFIPRFKIQFGVVAQAQRGIGNDISHGSLLQRTRSLVAVFSVMITWALENSIETADSMKSRGYGLPGRTAFSIYRFDERDKNALAWLCFCGIFIGCGIVAGGLRWRYFPSIKGVLFQPFSVAFMLVYLLLCITPVILNRREDKKWQSMRSAI